MAQSGWLLRRQGSIRSKLNGIGSADEDVGPHLACRATGCGAEPPCASAAERWPSAKDSEPSQAWKDSSSRQPLSTSHCFWSSVGLSSANPSKPSASAVDDPGSGRELVSQFVA